jgi:predicted acylesterase/phospholipase RssA
MNGVCREFYNAVRGRGAYKLIKALTDSDIIVDIISGTSAGGINGVLLSYALTNSTADQVADFANLAQIWRESGNILGLMRQPSPSDSQLDSILDGEGYYQKQLKEAFDKAQNSKAPAPTDEWLSEFNELDLFVTGTDVLVEFIRFLMIQDVSLKSKTIRGCFSSSIVRVVRSHLTQVVLLIL